MAALNDITFVKGQGGLCRPLPGQDFISGLLLFTANGNLRELNNVVKRAVLLTTGDEVQLDSLPQEIVLANHHGNG